jgi:putative transposase
MKAKRFTDRKCVYRIYREAGLAVRRRKRKRIGAVERKPLPKPVAANLSWSMDFVSDGLADGRRLRCLTVVDDCTRECLAIEVDTSITGTRVKQVMNRLADSRGLPRSITVDNGPEFQGQVLDAWAYQANVTLSFIRPGKPNENAYIESFNGKFRDECLNEHWFIRWLKPVESSNSGGSNTTRNVHTAQSEISHRRNTPRI